MAIQKGVKTILVTTTPVFDASGAVFKTVILQNTGANVVWFALNGAAAVAGEGFSLQPTGTANDRIALTSSDFIHPVVNAIAVSGSSTVAFQRL